MVFFLKPPPGNGVDPKMFSIIGAVAAVFALAEIGVGIWWMVFFNRAGVKAQFLPQALPYSYAGQGAAPYVIDMPHSATPPPPSLTTPEALASTHTAAIPTDVGRLSTPPIATPQRPARPLSISIIAWFILAGSIFIPFSIVLRAPTILFTAIFTGWHAVILLLVFGALHLYIGIALLKMKPPGRLVGMGYYLFSLLNTAVFFLAPGRSARIAKLLDAEQSMFSWVRSAQTDSPFTGDITPFLVIGAIFGIAFCLVLLYFLAAAKPAFDKAAQQAG
jgi:hypothetical protein